MSNRPHWNFIFAAFFAVFAGATFLRSGLDSHPAQVLTIFACGVIAGASTARGLQLRRAAAAA
jgi:hypothetical protein